MKYYSLKTEYLKYPIVFLSINKVDNKIIQYMSAFYIINQYLDNLFCILKLNFPLNSHEKNAKVHLMIKIRTEVKPRADKL